MPRNTVALGVRVPTAEASTQINPLQAGIDIMRIQQLSNENTRFQLQQQAYRGMAGIMQQHPGDEEGGLRDILQSPYAPYAGDFINTVRQSHLALLQGEKTRVETSKLGMEIGDTALSSLLRNTAPQVYGAVQRNASDSEIKSIVQGNLQRVLATTPPEQRQNVINAFEGWTTSITGGLPADPALRRQVMSDNIVHGMIGANPALTAQDWEQLLGRPGTVTTAAGQTPGVFAPTWAGGGFTAAQTAPGVPQFIPQGVAPGFHSPEEIPVPGSGAPAIPPAMGPYGFGGRPNALAPPTPTPTPTPTLGPGLTPTPSGGVIPPTAVQTMPSPAQAAGPPAPVSTITGQPLWSDTDRMIAPGTGVMTVGGAPSKSKAQADSAAEQNKTFDSSGAEEYESAQRMLGQLDLMNNAYDQLAHSKFLAPGAASALRMELSKGLNTIGTLTGWGDTVSPQDLATAEGLQKASRLLQYSTVRSFFGGQREAAQTISSAGQAVPGMDNTVLGGKLLTEELKAQANRLVDQRRWQIEWRNRNYSDLTGSKEAFDAKYPPQLYAQGVLEKFGMGPHGFVSGDAVATAVRNGWIPRQMGTQIINSQFPTWKPPAQGPAPASPPPQPGGTTSDIQ